MSICGIVLVLIFIEPIIALLVLAFAVALYIGIAVAAVAIPASILVYIAPLSPGAAIIISILCWGLYLGRKEESNINDNQEVEA